MEKFSENEVLDHEQNQKVIVQKILEITRQVHEGSASALEIRNLIDGQNDWKDVYAAIFEAARTIPQEYVWDLHELELSLGQEPQRIGLSEIQRLALKYYFDARIPECIRVGIAESFGLYLAQFGESSEWMEKPVSFTDVRMFEESWKVIDFLANAYAHSTNISSKGAAAIRKYLTKAVASDTASYILCVRVRELVAEMNGESHLVYEKDPLPVKIYSDKYGIARSDAVYLVPENRKAELESLRARWQEVNKELIRRRGGDGHLFRERSGIFTQGQALATEKVTARRLALKEGKHDPAQIEREYARLMHLTFRKYIEDDFGVSLPDSLGEQYYLLRFLRTVAQRDVTAVQQFSRQFGKNGLRTFLAAAADEGAGAEILAFARSAGPVAVGRVFAAFGELADKIEEMQGYLEQEYGTDKSTQIQGMMERLLLRGRDLLGQAHAYKDNPDKLRQHLEQRSAKGQMLLAMYRYLKEAGEAKTIADIQGVTYETKTTEELQKDSGLLNACVALYRKNWPDSGDALVKEFEENLTKSGGLVRLIQFEGRLVAFILVSPVDTQTVYLSALNADAEFATTNVGMLLFADVLQETVGQGKVAQFEALPKRFDQYKKHFQDQYDIAQIGNPFTDPKDNKITFKAEVRAVTQRDSK